MFGDVGDIERFNEWLGTLPHQHKLVVSGNHDAEKVGFEKLAEMLTNAQFLKDETAELEFPLAKEGGEEVLLKVYGSPWQPQFQGFKTHKSDKEAGERWRATMPADVDIVVTHTPPATILDDGQGSQELLAVLAEREALLSCFGHIHEPGQSSLSLGTAGLKSRVAAEGNKGNSKAASGTHLRSNFCLRTEEGRTLFVNDAVCNARDNGRYELHQGASAFVIVLQLPRH